ncbi:putative glucan endo-1,3-beta-glucosidase GVI [Abrus precatorius]|uniref:glucan endo-1,3-beta-D-glucosidase n=1 Tax=Abrus precatorius TaxID=3816 RepID=A0A8B8LFD8_ABRPR|nr:putative glucan endo-1,3-beta-glucosidase GVI [Abrus precatorius]
MALLSTISMYVIMVSILAIQLPLSASIGFNYGRLGNNLPAPQDVVALYKRCGIQLLRLFDPSPDVLEALRGSNLKVSLGVRNEDVQILASSPEAATQWVNTNVAPYKDDVLFRWITVGNEIIPGPQAIHVTQAMQNIYNAINSIGLTTSKVTTSFYLLGLASSFPPSAGAFTNEIVDVMKSVTTFLAQTGAPLMVNVYPYYSYTSDPSHITFEYASFQGTAPLIDGDLKYFSLFDAMVDSVYAALEKIGANNVGIIIGEVGWPTAGNEPYTTIQNAQTFNQKLLNHLQGNSGTPRRPGQPLDAFIFAIFNENQKPNGVEQNWGVFLPNMTPVYPLLSC